MIVASAKENKNNSTSSIDNLLHEYLQSEHDQAHKQHFIGSLRSGAQFEGTQSTEMAGAFDVVHGSDSHNQRIATSITGAILPSSFASFHLNPNNHNYYQDTQANRAYTVTVKLQYVDMEQDYLCGYLTIDDLTQDYPHLTTFFDGDIIGGMKRKNSFCTHRWGADERIDAEHWCRFDVFRRVMEANNVQSVREMDSLMCNNDNPGDTKYVFMRWKEQFLVPDHRVKSVHGASYDGFYYVMYDATKEQIEGYYYHDSSERNQHLKLKPAIVTSRCRSGSFEFN